MYSSLDISHFLTTLLGNFWPTVDAIRILEIVFCKAKKSLLYLTKQSTVGLVGSSVTTYVLQTGSFWIMHFIYPYVALKFDSGSLELIHAAIKLGRSHKAITLIVAYLLH